MLILGVNDSDASATLAADGEIVMAVREERLNRIKKYGDFPLLAIQRCLDAANAGITDLDYIGFFKNPGKELEPLFDSYFSRAEKDYLSIVPNNILSLIRGAKENKSVERVEQALVLEHGGKKIRIVYTPHHMAHMSGSFFISPFEEAAVLSLDARGEETSIMLGHGRGDEIRKIKEIKHPHSLGYLYTTFTQYLGFKANRDDGKVMGLSAYGEPTYYEDIMKMVRLSTEGGFELDLSYFNFYVWRPRRYSDKFLELLGPERTAEEPITDRHRDLASSIQKVLEQCSLHIARHLHKVTGARNLCLAGGVGMNSVLNGFLLRNSPFQRIYVPAGPDDGGMSLSVTRYIRHVMEGKARNGPLEHDFLGPEFSRHQVRAFLTQTKQAYVECADAPRQAAEMISRGKIIGWFQGRMEFGQRALGNRSILADPRDPSMKDRINREVKNREDFRPFAPSVLEEESGAYFDSSHPSPFMQLVYNVLPAKRSQVPAITHVDGTARVQTVSRKHSEHYWRLIHEFSKLTGVPMVLNTSFNKRGEPIVCTPEDAFRTFHSTGLDALFIGDFLVTKNGGPALE